MQLSMAKQGVWVVAALVIVIVGSEATRLEGENNELSRAKRSNFLAFPRMGRSSGSHVTTSDGCPSMMASVSRCLEMMDRLVDRLLLSHQGHGHFFAMPRRRSANVDAPNHTLGFLAFPRMGRSGGQDQEGSDACCPVGLRLEWSVGEDAKPQVTDVCEMEAGCCPGLEEIVRRKPAGGFYSMCLRKPAVGGLGKSFNKLKDLLSQ